VIKSVNDEEYKGLMWVVEDPTRKEKFSIHMSDEDFYTMHLADVIGLKTLIARVKYTIDEDEDGNIFIKNKEIVLVYRFNDTKRHSLPI
jgi:hypothetical protein